MCLGLFSVRNRFILLLMNTRSSYRPISVVAALLILGLSLGLVPAQKNAGKLKSGFVYLSQIDSTIAIDIRYATDRNFVGSRVDGYHSNKAILTKEAAVALKSVQSELAEFGLGLKVLDAYRPQRAVDHFMRWASDSGDKSTKEEYYPQVSKPGLIEQAYIARKSGHSKGSTVDVTIVDLKTGQELPMGTRFDFFDPRSWLENKKLPANERANRALLNAAMEKHGFVAYRKEWWHFRLRNEPFPKTYFDFPVE